MWLEGISSLEAGNASLPGFMARHNGRSARAPAQSEDLYRWLVYSSDRPRDVLCWRDQRYVGQQLTSSYERRRITLDASEITRGLVGQYVDTYAFPDGRLDIRWKGLSLPTAPSTPTSST